LFFSYLLTIIHVLHIFQDKGSSIPHRVAHWKDQKWRWANTFIDHRDINVWTKWYHGPPILFLNCVLTIITYRHVYPTICVHTSIVPYLWTPTASLLLIHTTVLIYICVLFWYNLIFFMFTYLLFLW
jgi:hypothetical protein